MPTDNIPEQGTLWICYDCGDGRVFRLCMGYVTKLNMSYNKTTSVTPIVTKRADEAFPLDGGTRKEYTINGYRIQPSEISQTVPTGAEYPPARSYESILEEQSAWSCEDWHRIAMGLVDRWQMKTDGCWLVYRPASTNPYVSIGTDGKAHGYIGSLEITYNVEYNELLSFYLTFTVGTMYVRREEGLDPEDPASPPHEHTEQTRFDDSYITMTSPDMRETYLIGTLDSSLPSAVESYTLVGGPGDPFEHISMTLSVNKLMDVAPELLDTGDDSILTPASGDDVTGHRISEGKTLIYVHAVGTSTFVVNKAQMSSNGKKIEIVGYCLAQKYKDATIAYESVSGTPYEVLDRILSDVSYGLSFVGSNRIVNKDLPSDGSDRTLSFVKGTNVWYALQVCSIVLGCKIFFANNKAYIIDYRVPEAEAAYPSGDHWSADEICTYTDTQTHNAIDVMPTDDSDFMYARVLESRFGGGGMDGACQKVVVSCSVDEDMREVVSYPAVAQGYGDGAGLRSTMVSVPELMLSSEVRVTAAQFAGTYLEYMAEPQTVVSMKVKECTSVDGSPGWKALFATVSQADSIYDRSRDTVRLVTNLSDLEVDGLHPRRYQKLYLSSYSRSFPEMTSSYTWGVINGVDLTNRLATDFRGLAIVSNSDERLFQEDKVSKWPRPLTTWG